MMTQPPHEKQGMGTPRRVSGPMIAFRCPNGHVGQVPAHLAGRKAKCPHCKTPMTIPVPPGSHVLAEPTPAETPPIAEVLQTPSLDTVLVVDEPAAEELPVLELEPTYVQESSTVHAGGHSAESLPVASEEKGGASHPTADLVHRLWAEREFGGKVEVHHVDGVIVPDWYDVAWSRGTHGVFGSQAPDGTVTITAVAWSAVQKVIVRQVQTLPADMFPTG
jgi:hypothetical protein